MLDGAVSDADLSDELAMPTARPRELLEEWKAVPSRRTPGDRCHCGEGKGMRRMESMQMILCVSSLEM